MRIGDVGLANKVVAAPMAGFTSQAYRLLAKKFGCGLVYSEMVSDLGLVYNQSKTKAMLRFQEAERPLAMQILGSDPQAMARAAALAYKISGCDIIDINMGCPTPKIVKNGEGSALMRKIPLAKAIVEAVVAAVPVPVTVKMRKGWDENKVNAVPLAIAVEAAGAQAVAVHGRTREQFYSGEADWEIIKQVKAHVGIPVIGNGDITSPERAAAMLAETGCDGVMIGRAGLGRPWLFQQVVDLLAKGSYDPEPALANKLAIALSYLDLECKFKGEGQALRESRKTLAAYVKGLPGASTIRNAINGADSLEEMEAVLTAAFKGK